VNAAEIIIRAVKHGIRFRMQRIVRAGEHLEVTVCDGDLECSRRMFIDDSPEYNDMVLATIKPQGNLGLFACRPITPPRPFPCVLSPPSASQAYISHSPATQASS
jgi:hypothetical protein